MANFNILQQYADAYNQQIANAQRQAERYNAGVSTYNTALNNYNTKTQPQITNLQNKYNYELNHYNKDIEEYNANLWASNRDYWDATLASYRNYHYGNANNYNAQMAALERTVPISPSALQGVFNEKAYLNANPDVAAAVARGQFKSGLEHFQLYGKNENRLGLGGAKNQALAKQGADWEANTKAALNSYVDALQSRRIAGAPGVSQEEVDRRRAAYEALISQRPEFKTPDVKAPSFTQEQINAMQGKQTIGKQALAQEGGLISNERVSAAAERNSPSFISGILAQARK